jgi:hypothetical protein
MHASSDISPERVPDVLVGHREIKPVAIKVTTAPALCIDMLSVGWIGHDREKVLVTAHPTHVLRRARAFAGDTRGDPGSDGERNMPFDLDGVYPVVAEIVDVGEGYAVLAAEVAKSNLALVEDTRVVLEAALFQDIGVSITKSADAEFVQMITPPVEGRLDRKMEFAEVPGSRHDKPSPDRRADFGQRDLDLQCAQFPLEHRRLDWRSTSTSMSTVGDSERYEGRG